MPVPSSIADLSTSPASNSPAGADSIGTSLDEYLRTTQAILKQNVSKGSDIASSSTITIPASGSYFLVTGNTTITAVSDTNQWDGRTVFLEFSGTPQLTHSSGLVLPGATNYPATAGDVAIVTRKSTGTYKVIILSATVYQPLMTAASQAEMEAGTEANIRSMSPLRVAQAISSLSSSKLVPVRQTVLSGPVDTNGLPLFGGSTGSTTVTASGTLRATAANGFSSSGQVDRVGSITNPSWTGLSTNGTMYLYLDIAADGTCTTGSTTLAPTYRWGGADVVTNNQFTFNIQEMVGKVGNGSSAVQMYRVFVGEVTVAGGVVTAIVWYALMGRYDSGWFSVAGNTTYTKSANVGSFPAFIKVLGATNSSGLNAGEPVIYTTGPATGGFWVGNVTPLGVSVRTDTGSVRVKDMSGAAQYLDVTYLRMIVNRGW